MAGRRVAPPIDPALCRRCQTNAPTITVRIEPLCTACFHKYVATKVVKRMESFRVRHNEPGHERTLLLPLSFGAGSTTLLYLLSEHLKGQAERTGRTGFGLHILHISDGSGVDDHASQLEKVKERFPGHAYSSRPLSDILTHENLLSLVAKNGSESDDSPNDIESLFALLDSPTSRTDVQQILRRRIIRDFAKQEQCEAVLWGDSTTRLAERTLAETAKGRGFSLPWIVADGQTIHDTPVYYPMRDLLSKEIVSFTEMIDPPLDPLTVKDQAKRSVSMRDATIDGLMKQYFESVERDYPSIVANVVKTAGKLQRPSLADVEAHCELCEMPLAGAAPEKSRLCYGCVRTLGQSV